MKQAQRAVMHPIRYDELVSMLNCKHWWATNVYPFKQFPEETTLLVSTSQTQFKIVVRVPRFET